MIMSCLCLEVFSVIVTKVSQNLLSLKVMRTVNVRFSKGVSVM
jgi:hypothetical protein